MFDYDVKRLFSNIILDPYELTHIRLLVGSCRQDFLNSVTKLLDYKYQPGTFNHKNKKMRRICEEIHQKRTLLDDLERALEVATNGDTMELEKRSHFVQALDDYKYKDDDRYEKIIDRECLGVKRMSEIEILIDIRKKTTELYYLIHKIRKQEVRKENWHLYGPPSNIRREFDESYEKYSNTDLELNGAEDNRHNGPKEKS